MACKQAASWGGSLINIGIYALNAARYLTREEPVELTAFESSNKSDPRFAEVEDNIHFILRFPSGILATCTSSYSIERVTHYQIIGSKSWLQLDPATELKKHNSISGNTESRKQNGIDEGNQFAAELDHMADCVLNDKIPSTPGEEGLKDVKIILAAYQSAATKTAISLI